MSDTAAPAPAARRRPRLSVGPVLYHWPRETLLEFYSRLAETAVDIVYLGETVCSKRRALRPSEWLALAEQLEEAGKQAVVSTLALVEAESELSTLTRLCENRLFLVEANDMAAVSVLSSAAVPFVAGPTINIYNGRTLGFLAERGLKRWVAPVELSAAALADIQAVRPEGIETEVFSFGRLPLAFSARCFTARARNLPKDQCGLCCAEHPDGLLLSTREDQPFLILNGIQTQSVKTYSLVAELDALASMQVDVVRISPQSRQTERVIDLVHAGLSGGMRLADAAAEAAALVPAGITDGYWHGRAGMEASPP